MKIIISLLLLMSFMYAKNNDFKKNKKETISKINDFKLKIVYFDNNGDIKKGLNSLITNINDSNNQLDLDYLTLAYLDYKQMLENEIYNEYTKSK